MKSQVLWGGMLFWAVSSNLCSKQRQLILGLFYRQTKNHSVSEHQSGLQEYREDRWKCLLFCRVSEAQEATANEKQSLAKEHTHQSEESPTGKYLTVMSACRHRCGRFKKEKKRNANNWDVTEFWSWSFAKSNIFSFILAFPVYMCVQVLITS